MLYNDPIKFLNYKKKTGDGNRTHQNAFRSCDSNFVRKTIEMVWIKNFDSQMERTPLRSKKSLAMS